MRRLLFLGFVVAIAAVAAGCGGDSETADTSQAPGLTSADIARCFEEEGATAINEKTENSLPTTTALSDHRFIAAILTGDKQASKKTIEEFRTGFHLEAFAANGGEAVGVVGQGDATNKRLVLSCLE